MQIRTPESPDSDALCSNEWDPRIPKYVLAQSLGLLALPESKLSHSTPRPLLASCGLALGYSGCGQSPGWPRCSSHGAQLPPACTAKCPPAPNHCPPPSGWEGSVAAHPATTTVSTPSLPCPPKEWSTYQRDGFLQGALVLFPAMPSTQKMLTNR